MGKVIAAALIGFTLGHFFTIAAMMDPIEKDHVRRAREMRESNER